MTQQDLDNVRAGLLSYNGLNGRTCTGHNTLLLFDEIARLRAALTHVIGMTPAEIPAFVEATLNTPETKQIYPV